MDRPISDEQLFEKLSRVDLTEAITASPPSRLKAKIYSELMRRQSAAGPLVALSQTKAAGRGLCAWEELVRIAPVGESVKSFNLCRVCHARVLAERIENAPIHWAHCPYADFQKS